MPIQTGYPPIFYYLLRANKPKSQFMTPLKTLIVFAAMMLTVPAFAQFGHMKKFDYRLLENKTLLIPEWDVKQRWAKRMLKKGKFTAIDNAEAQAQAYNDLWKKAMAESSYDASDYEIRAYDQRALLKEKNEEAMLLYYRIDEYDNVTANLLVTGPQKLLVATSIINGIDLGDANDVKLMMNMLNYSLNVNTELEEEGKDAGYSNIRSKYKSNYVAFFEGIADKTFLVPRFKHKNEKKEAKINAEIKAALKEAWTISKYEFVTDDEIEKRRRNGDTEAFYWRNFNVYTNSPLITYRFNVLFTADRDEMIVGFIGKKALKGAAIEKTQDKMTKRYERFKRQLERKK